MVPNARRHGVTLVEWLIVIIVLGIVAVVVIPGLATAGIESAVTATASDLRDFSRATTVWADQCGGDLPLSNAEYREGIAAFLPIGATDRKPAIGGNYGFHVWGQSDHAAVGVWAAAAPDLFVDVDAIIDDGDLYNGSARAASSNGLLLLTAGNLDNFDWP